MNLENLENIVKELHKLNFGEGGLIEFGADYCFARLKENNGMHKVTEVKVCHECDTYCNGKAEFTRISHGTHTFDFLDAHGVGRETVAGWPQVPVLFVMENPNGIDKNDSDKFDKGNAPKRYVKTRWHWIESQYGEPNEEFIFPNHFDGYGRMVYSVIRTFKMANAYVTNMVKCGMTDGKNYLTTNVYPEGIVENCVGNFLQNELKDLCKGGTQKPIVFAFGDRAYSHVKELLNREFQGVEPVLLPHPSPKNPLSKEDRQYILFGKILHALFKNDFYKDAEKPNFRVLLSSKTKNREDFFRSHLILDWDVVENRKTYSDEGEICYEFSKTPEALVLRQRLKKGEKFISWKGKKYPVLRVWTRYTFMDKIEFSVSPYANKGEWFEPDENTREDFQPYRIIKDLAQKYQAGYVPSKHSGQ